MRTRSLFVALCLPLLCSCSDSTTDPGNTTNTSTHGGTYQPGTKGSTWSYSGSQDYTVTINGDTTINGKTYLIADNSSSGPGLVLVENGVYTQWAGLDLTEDGAPYLKESVPVGGSWSYQYGASSYTVNVVAAGITHTVNGHLYNDVLKMHQKVMFGAVVVSEGDYYYAKNVGFIENDFGQLGRFYLKSYTIK